jgi:mannose/fructose/N-acetylgalactosamine-specific phosphotransferase system component IID
MKKLLLGKLVIRSFFLQTGFNYERLQGLGWCWVIRPLARKFQMTNPDEFYLRNLEPFNANPYISTYAAGAVSKLIEENRDVEEIQRLKNSLGGPLGSLGDSLVWKGIRPALLALGILVSLWLEYWGAIVFLVLFNRLQLYLRWRGVKKGHQLGEQIFVEFSGTFWKKVPLFFGAVGAVLLGILLILKGGEFFKQNAVTGVIFLLALTVSLIGFLKRISAFDIFLLCAGSGLLVKLLLIFSG